MRGVSAASLEQLLDAVGGATADGADGVQVGNDVLAVVRVLATNPVLRRVLSDPATEDSAKEGLSRSLFGGKVSDGALRLVDAAVTARWSGPRDLVDGLEQVGVRCLLSRAQREQALESVADTLFAFARTVESDPELRATLDDRNNDAEGRKALVSRLVDGKVDDVTLALARLSVDSRDVLFEEALTRYANAAIGLEGRLHASVTAAYDLDDDEKRRLADGLARKYGRGVHVDVTVDPSVIGGLAVEIEGDRIDGTVATKLADARRGLVG